MSWNPLMGILGVPYARLVQTVTSVTLVNNTAKTVDTTVPSGKRWKLLSVKAVNGDDVTRVVTVNIFKEAAKTNLIARIANVSAGAGVPSYWPSTDADLTNSTVAWYDIILDEGNTISVTWAAGGASTGAVDADGLVVCYLEVDV